MNIQLATMMYQSGLKFILPIAEDFEEKDAGFAPQEGMMTVVQQIRHTALTVDWFWEGAFSGNGFDMDFEKHMAEAAKPSTVAEAVQLLKDSHERCIKALESMSDEELMEPMVANEIFGEAPKSIVFGPTSDHTAHHRGSLAVYLRLCGKTPKMIYDPEK